MLIHFPPHYKSHSLLENLKSIEKFEEEKASIIFHRGTADSLEQVLLFFFYGHTDHLYTGKIAFAINSFFVFYF